jgi:hypothetical protein
MLGVSSSCQARILPPYKHIGAQTPLVRLSFDAGNHHYKEIVHYAFGTCNLLRGSGELDTEMFNT